VSEAAATDTEARAGFVKVRLTDLEGTNTETLWAVSVAPGRFRLDNLPFFAYRVSVGDLVEGTEYAPGMYDFTRVVEASGNRCIRMILPEGETSDTTVGKAFLDEILALGCGFEGANRRYFAINIPPAVDLPTVADMMVQAGVTREYVNPTWDDLFGPTSSHDIPAR
jgi:hypothetical protein